MGGGDRRRIVEAVADHEYTMALVLQVLDQRDLVGRLHVASPMCNVEFGGDRGDGLLAVAGKNEQSEAKRAQRPHGFDGIRPKLLADGDDCRLPAMDEADGGCAWCAFAELDQTTEFEAAQSRFDAAERSTHALPRFLRR